MVWVVPKVELNIQSSLHGADNWTDVTADVRGQIAIQTGRQSELDRYSASTCSFSLDNRTRKYDFTYAAGPYFGLLIPRMEVRITATYLTITYPLFFGRIQGWPLDYQNLEQMAFVNLTAVDGFDIWSQKRWSGHPYATYLQSLAPYMWFRLVAEGERAATLESDTYDQGAYDAFGRYFMIFTEGALSNDPTGGPIQADAKAENQGRTARFANSGWSRVYAPPLPTLPTLWSAGCWFKAFGLAHHAAGGTMPAGIFGIGKSIRVYITWDSNGNGVFKVHRRQDATSFDAIFTGSPVADGKWHHVMLVQSSTDFRIFLDGRKLLTSTLFAGHDYDDVSSLILGRQLDTATYQPLNGFIHDFFTLQFAPSDAVVDGLYQAAINWTNQTTSQRIVSILTVFIQDLIVQDIDAGLMRIAPITNVLDGAMLESLQKAADVEGGHFYFNPDGSIAFRKKNTPLTATRSLTTQATFGDSGSDVRYLEATPTLDLQFMYNEVIASREGGGTYVARDINSQDAYEARSRDNGELPYANDNDAIAQAQWIVELYGTPKARLPYVKFSARYSQAAMEYALGSKLLDRVVVRRTPTGGGAQWTFTTHVESKHTIIDLNALTWETTFTLTQNSVVSGFLKLGHATDGKLGTGRLGA